MTQNPVKKYLRDMYGTGTYRIEVDPKNEQLIVSNKEKGINTRIELHTVFGLEQTKDQFLSAVAIGKIPQKHELTVE